MNYEEAFGLAYSNIKARDQKLQTLTEAKKAKETTLGINSEVSYNPAIITSLTDADSPIFKNIGNEDRVQGFDAYEVRHNDKVSEEYFKSPSGIRKLERQKEFYSKQTGIPIDKVTNDMIFNAGMDQTYEALNLLNRNAQGGMQKDLIQATMRPDGTGNIFGKDKPLNLQAQRAVIGKDYFGRDLTSVKSAQGESLTQHFNTPSHNTDYGNSYAKSGPHWDTMVGTSDGTNRIENLVDALQYGVGRKAAGIADSIVEAGTDLGERIYAGAKGVSRETAHEHFKNTMQKNKFTADMFDKKGNFTGLDKYKTAKEYGYDQTLTQEAMADWSKAYDSGSVWEMAKSVVRNIDKAPEFIAESAGEFITAPIRSVGVLLNTFDYANNTLDRRKEITGQELSSISETGAAALAGWGQAILNKYGVDEMIGRTNVVGKVVSKLADMTPEKLTKGVVQGAISKVGKALTVGAGKGIYEGTEEVLQQMMEIVGAKIGTDKANEIFSDTTGKELFQAFGGGFVAGAGMRAPMAVKETAGAMMDMSNEGLNKLAEASTGKTAKGIETQRTIDNIAKEEIAKRRIQVTDGLSELDTKRVEAINSMLDSMAKMDKTDPEYQTKFNEDLATIDELRSKMTFPETQQTTPTTSAVEQAQETVQHDPEVQKHVDAAGFTNMITKADREAGLDLELDDGYTASKEVTKRKSTTFDPMTMDDAFIDTAINEGLTKEALGGKFTTTEKAINMVKRLAKKLGVGSDQQQLVKQQYEKVKESFTNGTPESLQNLEKTTGSMTAAKAMRATAIAMSAIGSATTAEYDIAKKAGSEAVQGARLLGLDTQIGKAYVNSYGLRVKGSAENTAKKYAEIGQAIMDYMKAEGMITSDERFVPVHNMRDAEGKPLNKESISKMNVGQFKTDSNGKVTHVMLPTVKLTSTETKGRKGKDGLRDAMHTFSKLFTPSNYQVPSTTASTEVVYDESNPISKEHAEIIKQYQKLKYKIKPEMLNVLKEIRDAIKESGMSIDKALAQPEYMRMLGLHHDNAAIHQLNKDGRSINRRNNLINVLDNLDEIEAITKDGFNYSYESAINDRIHVLETILEFQGDKYMSRQMVTEGEYTLDTANEVAYEILLKDIADNLPKPMKGDIEAITTEGVNKDLDLAMKILDKGEMNLTQAMKLAGNMKFPSVFKAMSVLQAVHDIRTAKDGKVKTQYMVESDATASGIANTFLNLSGMPMVQEVLAKLKGLSTDGNIDAYQLLWEGMRATLGEEMFKDTFGDILAKLDKAGINERDLAKSPAMTSAYGQSEGNAAVEMATSTTETLIKKALEDYNQGAMDLITEVLGEKKYAIDTVDGKTALREITTKDVDTLVKYFQDKLGAEVVSSIKKTYAGIGLYREVMNTIFKTLDEAKDENGKKLWDGKIASAIETMLGNPKNKMSVKKLMTMPLRDEDGKLYSINEMMNNATSFNVNLQHSTDAAILLKTLHAVMKKLGPENTKGIMTVHDAFYSNPETAKMIMEYYNRFSIDAAMDYDYITSAIKELEGLKGKGIGAKIDATIKAVNEKLVEATGMNAEELLTAKKEFLKNKQIRVLGDSSVNVDALTREDVTGDKVSTEEKNTAESDAVKEVLKSVTKMASTGKINMTAVAQALRSLPNISETHKELLNKLKDSKVKVSTVLDTWGGANKVVYIPSTVSNKITDVNGNKILINTTDKLIEVFAHELDHAIQYEYIKANMESNEMKYLTRVIESLGKVDLSTILNPKVRMRIEYILDPAKDATMARKITELSSIVMNEMDVQEGILQAINGNKTTIEKIKDIIAKVVQAAKDFFKTADVENLEISAEYTLMALKELDANARAYTAAATIKDTDIATMVKQKDVHKGNFVNPFEAVNDVIAETNSFASDWMIIWGDTMKEFLGPKLSEGHKKLKAESSLYRTTMSLIRTAFYDSDMAQRMHQVLGVAQDTKSNAIKAAMTIATNYQQWSNTERQNMVKMSRELKNTYSKKQQKVIHRIFADTGIANLQLMKDIHNGVLDGSMSLDDAIAKVSKQIDKADMAKLDEVSEYLVTGNTTNNMVNVYATGMKSDAAMIYITLQAMKKIPNSQKLLVEMRPELKKWMLSMALVNKTLNDQINEKNADYKGDMYSEDAEFNRLYDGSYSMDVYDKKWEFKIVSESDMKRTENSSEFEWKVIKEPVKGQMGIIARETLDAGYTTGVGLELNRYVNGVMMSYEQSKAIYDELNKFRSEADKQAYLAENGIVKDGMRFRMLIDKETKREQLGLVEDAAESLYRTYIHNAELISSEQVRRTLLEGGTQTITTEKGMQGLEDVLRRNDEEGLTGIRQTVYPFLSIDYGAEGLKDIKTFDDLKTKYPMIAKYYKTPTGLTSFNNFNKKVSLVKRGVSEVLIGHKNTSIFGGTDNREAARWENLFKKLVVLAKQKMIVTNPVKLINDSITNIGILSMMDVPITEIYSGMKEGFEAYKEFSKARSTLVHMTMNARMAHAEMLMNNTEENKNKAKYALDRVQKFEEKMKDMAFYDAYNEGFMQSYSTDMVTKEYDVISGLQKDVDEFIDKYTHDDKGKANRLFKAIKWWQTFGPEMDKTLNALGKSAKLNGTDLGTEIVELSERLAAKKADKDSVSRYVSDLIGAPASEVVSYGSAYMVTADALSKYVLAKHLMSRENPTSGKRGHRRLYTKAEAYAKANETFIDYRTNIPSEIKALSDYGVLMFPAYWMKVQKVIAGLIKYHPVGVGLAIGIETAMGMESMNVVASQNIVSKATNYGGLLHSPNEYVGMESLLYFL